ncbi:unnamed protein product [Amaranthus hypochondriacus]
MLGTCINNASFLQSLITLFDHPKPLSVLKQIHGLIIASGLSKLFSIFADLGNVNYTHRLLLHNPSPSVVH